MKKIIAVIMVLLLAVCGGCLKMPEQEQNLEEANKERETLRVALGQANDTVHQLRLEVESLKSQMEYSAVFGEMEQQMSDMQTALTEGLAAIQGEIHSARETDEAALALVEDLLKQEALLPALASTARFVGEEAVYIISTGATSPTLVCAVITDGSNYANAFFGFTKDAEGKFTWDYLMSQNKTGFISG